MWTKKEAMLQISVALLFDLRINDIMQQVLCRIFFYCFFLSDQKYLMFESTSCSPLKTVCDSELLCLNYTCQLFLIPMREIFFPVPWPPERGLGPSSKGTGANMNEAEHLPLHGCFTRFSGAPAENALFPVVHSKRRHLLVPHQSLLLQILQFPFDFDVNQLFWWVVLVKVQCVSPCGRF